MAKGYVDITPASLAEAIPLLPRGVTVHGSHESGGAIRLSINGPGIKKGRQYQVVITDEPLRRVVELVETPDA